MGMKALVVVAIDGGDNSSGCEWWLDVDDRRRRFEGVAMCRPPPPSSSSIIGLYSVVGLVGLFGKGLKRENDSGWKAVICGLNR